MRLALMALPLLVATTAPANPPAPRAGDGTVQGLQHRLPGVVEAWGKRYGPGLDGRAVVLRRVRALGPADAKVSIYLHSKDAHGAPHPAPDFVLTVFLRSYGGLWTVLRYDWDRPDERLRNAANA